jgi:hypothetical protein
MQIRTFRQHSSESFVQRPPCLVERTLREPQRDSIRWGIGQWFYKNRRAIFIAMMRVAVYSTISVAAYHTYTGSLSIFMFLKEYVFPVFQEVM